VTIVTRGLLNRFITVLDLPAATAVRTLNRTALREGFRSAHEYTKAMLADLPDAALNVPQLPILNPFLWELGHVGWFTENFCLRWRGLDLARRPSMLAHADRWYDSSNVAHDTRWSLDLPPRAQTERYVRQVMEATLAALERAEDSDEALYLFRLALFHEDMHAEAFSYMRHTLGMPPPAPLALAAAPACELDANEAVLPGGEFALGASAGAGFVFDNEKWAHEVTIAPFAVSRRLVSNAEFAAFIEDDGYRRDELWSPEGLAWRNASARAHPRDWQRQGGNWRERWFDEWRALRGDAPVRHVTAHEADAYCRWARRRLPTEAEWECAAISGAIEPLGLWEWTSSMFTPYPGFAADAYADYSAPWFGTHRVLRGASFATPQRLHHPRFRNFFLPQRDDIFVGLRTCALP
jgi:ergothioneine biosynthesis protein EgtB